MDLFDTVSFCLMAPCMFGFVLACMAEAWLRDRLATATPAEAGPLSRRSALCGLVQCVAFVVTPLAYVAVLFHHAPVALSQVLARAAGQ